MPKGTKKRKDRQKSGPDSAHKDEPKRQRKMMDYLVADDRSGSERSDSDSDAEDKPHSTPRMVRGSDTDMRLQQILDGQTDIQAVLVKIQDDLNSFKQYQERTDEKLTAISERQATLENTLNFMERRINYMERKQRERNLRLIGVMETNQENCYDILWGILSEFRFETLPQIEVAHRTGRRGHQPRHIILRTVKLQDKVEILRRQREALRDKSYFFTDDLTAQDYKTKQQLRPEIEKAKREGKRWVFKEGQLFIEGRPFVPNSNKKGDEPRTSTGLKPQAHAATAPVRNRNFHVTTGQASVVQRLDRQSPRYQGSSRNPWPNAAHPGIPHQYGTQQVTQAQVSQQVSQHFPPLPYSQSGNVVGNGPQKNFYNTPEIHWQTRQTQHEMQTSPSSEYLLSAQLPPQELRQGSHQSARQGSFHGSEVVMQQRTEQRPPVRPQVVGPPVSVAQKHPQHPPPNTVNLTVNSPEFQQSPTVNTVNLSPYSPVFHPPSPAMQHPPVTAAHTAPVTAPPHPSQPARNTPAVTAPPHPNQPARNNPAVPSQLPRDSPAESSHHQTTQQPCGDPSSVPILQRQPHQA